MKVFMAIGRQMILLLPLLMLNPFHSLAQSGESSDWTRVDSIVATISGAPILETDILMENDLGLLQSSHLGGGFSALLEAYLKAVADPEFLRQVAPLYHLENVNTPVQVHIGTADGLSLVETPPEWSTKLAGALRIANRDVAYYEYEGQGHFFTGESWYTLLERALGFYDELVKG